MHKYTAEAVGTAILVFFAVGSTVFGLNVIGAVGVALAFGLLLMGLMYAIGPVSGAHLNPAITLGMWLSGRIRGHDAGLYIVAQVIGAIVGAAFIKIVTAAGNVNTHHVSGANAFGTGTGINLGGAFLLEILLTFLLVFVMLMVTRDNDVYGFVGLAVGVAYAVVHLVGVPLDGTSANPARSIGPALYNGGHAIGQLWLFIIAPLVGAVLAWLAESAVRPLRARTANEGPLTERR